ncbi:aldose 1-epimerase family protein [Mucilaginibacter myungsuensis]|uniref:Aldose 1-epimerase family protein n=1 Tax=Mucilaginibacter myungsuensis TaxID=649104 RepID=A0A929L1X7_9SPHI|nr:aldose 1-epimerase family protein [Mucilaginibacter myungsuensis]MBE9662595.1 aldose 1-epimerase family protein [Mucilaginibacter myungsuensis]MDN3598015.1 aldose 1-epimerase family protein [Mucilaginibacter myungsuensis]
MTVIENEYLKASIDHKGAQLSSLIDKATGREIMWHGDAWPSHAPNLFPVVGSVINSQIVVDGKTYDLPPRHGFARGSDFSIKETNGTHAKFSLKYSEATLKMYPYKFDFQVIYDLIDNALRITYKVLNLDERTIYFSVGGHPAFNVPFNEGENYEDYYLEFEIEEPLDTHLLGSDGFFNGQTEPVKLEGRNLPLTREMFAKDALVFVHPQSRQVAIRSTKHNESLTVQFPHFPYLGIWAKPGADFVCIEPWLGHADVSGKPVELKNKAGIQKLVHGHVFDASYYISI